MVVQGLQAALLEAAPCCTNEQAGFPRRVQSLVISLLRHVFDMSGGSRSVPATIT